MSEEALAGKRREGFLVGRQEICSYTARGWRVVSRWIKERNFPAKKIDGQWESYTDMIDQWHREQIAGNKPGSV